MNALWPRSCGGGREGPGFYSEINTKYGLLRNSSGTRSTAARNKREDPHSGDDDDDDEMLDQNPDVTLPPPHPSPELTLSLYSNIRAEL